MVSANLIGPIAVGGTSHLGSNDNARRLYERSGYEVVTTPARPPAAIGHRVAQADSARRVVGLKCKLVRDRGG